MPCNGISLSLSTFHIWVHIYSLFEREIIRSPAYFSDIGPSSFSAILPSPSPEPRRTYFYSINLNLIPKYDLIKLDLHLHLHLLLKKIIQQFTKFLFVGSLSRSLANSHKIRNLIENDGASWNFVWFLEHYYVVCQIRSRN